jgi:predicted TPR repeat methyltransferase
MTGMIFPSGDLNVDRRAGFAESMAYLGDLDAAIEVLAEALEQAPDWAAGWFRLGEYHERAGDMTGAVSCWQKALAADPADPFGASLKCDLVEQMPAAFVETLFDQYAPRFDASLVEGLSYRGPQEIMAELGTFRMGRVLDLGCGTGLMGAELRGQADWLEGWDLSTRMLAEAEGKAIYDALDKRDIAALDLGGTRWDVIVAADVFAYVGALERVVGWCAGSLAPGGRLVFSVELSEAEPVVLRESRRFAHSRAYIAGLLAQAGFGEVALRQVVLRMDRGQPIQSLVVMASGLGVGRREGEGEAEAFA